MAAKGASREKGSNETVIHWRLAMAKDTTMMAMGRPMVQRKIRCSIMPSPFSRSRSSLPVLKKGTRFGADINGAAGARVAAGARLAGLDREGPEAAQLDTVALAHCPHDLIENGIDDAFDVAMVKMRSCCPRSGRLVLI